MHRPPTSSVRGKSAAQRALAVRPSIMHQLPLRSQYLTEIEPCSSVASTPRRMSSRGAYACVYAVCVRLCVRTSVVCVAQSADKTMVPMVRYCFRQRVARIATTAIDIEGVHSHPSSTSRHTRRRNAHIYCSHERARQVKSSRQARRRRRSSPVARAREL